MKKALLIIDLQNDYMNPNRPFAIKQEELDHSLKNAPQVS